MSSEQSTRTPLEDVKVGTRLKLSGLWVSLMLLYIYADFLSLFKLGAIDEILKGFMGPFPVSQAALLMAAALMAIPALLVFLTLALPASPSRWTNLIFGGLYILVNISNLIGETWAFYWMFGLIEIIVTLMIVVLAWTWPRHKAM